MLSPHVMATGFPVLFTATPQGPLGATYYYQFSVDDGTGAGFVVQQPWGAASTWSLADTTLPGNYVIRVEVGTLFGTTDASASMSYVVAP
jgi:hypothetical protein